MNKNLLNIIKTQKPYTINNTDFNLGKKYEGKVRDVYTINDKMLIVTTDRISAFDKVVTSLPFKGEILNTLSLYWFEKTKDIIDNHVIKKVSNNAMLVKKCKILPVEFIVRGYLTGGGWREYEKTGKVSGIELDKGLKKNCKFETPILTPSTKAETGHDKPISVIDIVKQGILSKNLLDKVTKAALDLFKRGQELVEKNNLILVDTKYEFGLLDDGSLILADEIHTSDSSRFWFKDCYEEKFSNGEEQKMLDKEYFRLWLTSVGFNGDNEVPVVPDEVLEGILSRYLDAYRHITGSEYDIKNYDASYELKNAVNNLQS